MYAAQPAEPETMTEAEYLAFEETSPEKHEYSRGTIYAMTGGSFRHSVIIGNTITQLNIGMNRPDCTVSSSDLRIHISSKQSYRYPDITVVCGQPAYVGQRTDTISNPVVLVEVLSPVTMITDRNDKLAEYTTIESLQTYLLISQDLMKIERYQRYESGQWLYQIATGPDAIIDLPSIDCKLTLSDIYQKVTWDEEEA